MEEFLQVNTFLRDLNAENEKDENEKPGGRGLAKLENIVAIAFDEDRRSSLEYWHANSRHCRARPLRALGHIIA